MISIENLTYYYPDSEEASLDNINLTIEEGEFILLLGPSGCGKSTLVQCLNGIIPKVAGGDLTGEIFINKKNVRDHKVYQLSTDVGLVFQNPDTQLFGLTVEEDVAFGPENLGIEREGIRARVKHSLETVGLKDLKDRFTFTLSGGEKQRTAIAGNLAMEPKILVLDEPTSDLDPAGTKEVFETLKRLNRDRRITIILIEHKIDEVMGLADRSVVMDKGRIILDGWRKLAFICPS
jgi:energy-coupling factor transport system ATP-binding protein